MKKRVSQRDPWSHILARLCLITSAAASSSAIGASIDMDADLKATVSLGARVREMSERMHERMSVGAADRSVPASVARAELSASTDRIVRAAMARVESALPPPTRFVKVLDRPSERTITISWRESTLCHYNDQIWRAGIAKHAGTCAVSGMHIERGDSVYRPITTRPAPINANAMILSAAIADQAILTE